jgi:hypothetical protein
MFLSNWNLKVTQKTLKNSVPIAQETHGAHITTTTNRLTLFREINLSFLITKHNTSCRQNAEFVNVNLLKPTGHVMHQRVLPFNNCTLCPHCTYVFCIYLTRNSDLCHLHHKLIGFYNRDEKCSQRGTNWVFKYSSLRFFCKGLKLVIASGVL